MVVYNTVVLVGIIVWNCIYYSWDVFTGMQFLRIYNSVKMFPREQEAVVI